MTVSTMTRMPPVLWRLTKLAAPVVLAILAFMLSGWAAAVNSSMGKTIENAAAVQELRTRADYADRQDERLLQELRRFEDKVDSKLDKLLDLNKKER